MTLSFYFKAIRLLLSFAALSSLITKNIYADYRSVPPIPVKSTHPRLYITPDRIEKLRAVYHGVQTSYESNFPQQKGLLRFDIKPHARQSTDTNDHTPIFDTYDINRNHIFIRHIDKADEKSKLTGCGFSESNSGLSCMQLALQSTGGEYVAAVDFPLTVENWHSISISWDTNIHHATLQIDQNTPVILKWSDSHKSELKNWQPSDQQLVFSGRDALDNIELYGNNLAHPSSLLVSYDVDGERGPQVTDRSGHGHHGRISPGVVRFKRDSPGGNFALKFDAPSAKLVISKSSKLFDIWSHFFSNALLLVDQLNQGKPPVNVTEGHPEISKALGLAYLVTGEEKFLNAGLRYADMLLNVSHDAGDDYYQAFRIEAMGLIYDWINPGMRVTNRHTGRQYGVDLASAIMETIQLQGEFICGQGNNLREDWRCNNIASPDALSGHSYTNNTGITTALLAIIGEYPELSELLATEYQNFISLYYPLRAWLSVDGGSHMGWGYGAVYSKLDSVQLWTTALSPAPQLKHVWQGKIIDRFIYGMRGDMSFPVSGDTLYRRATDELVSSFSLIAAKDFNNQYAANFYNRWIFPYAADNNTYRLSELLYWEPELNEAPIEELEYSRLFRNAGQVTMRDSWNYPEATLVEFKSSSFSSLNHHHLDQNAFTVFYKAPLLIDSGLYDEYNSSHWQNYFIRTIAHNTLTIWDPDEIFGKIARQTVSNDGGQKIPVEGLPKLSQIENGGVNHLDGVIKYEYSTDITYTVGNASKAYAASKLDQEEGFLRTLIFIRKPDYWSHPIFVVFDQVKTQAGKDGLVKRFLLHSVNEPEPIGGDIIRNGCYLVDGKTLTIRNGSGMLFSQTLLPERAVIHKIGGQTKDEDHRFMVETANSAGQYQLLNYPPKLNSPRVNTDMGAWRIEVMPERASQQELFLHVLSVADNDSNSSPPTAVNLSSNNAAVVLLENRHLIVLNKSTENAEYLNWEMPATSPKIFIAGLHPNSSYEVKKMTSKSQDKIEVFKSDTGSLKSSSQGTLTLN